MKYIILYDYPQNILILQNRFRCFRNVYVSNYTFSTKMSELSAWSECTKSSFYKLTLLYLIYFLTH